MSLLEGVRATLSLGTQIASAGGLQLALARILCRKADISNVASSQEMVIGLVTGHRDQVLCLCHRVKVRPSDMLGLFLNH